LNAFDCQAPIETETGWTTGATLTEESAYLRGHFPGNPILPAVAQLALVTQVARSAWDRAVNLEMINDLRFRKPLFPGAELEVRLGPFSEAEDARFSLFLADKPVSQGSVRWTTAAPSSLPAFETFTASDPADPPILLPQEAEARYIHECTSSDADGLRCLAFVPPANPFRTDTELGCMIPAFLALEMGAQAAATHEGVMRAVQGAEAEAVGGYVVRCRQAKFETTLLPADALFRVSATCVEAAPPLRTYKITVGLDQRVLVEGLVSTFAEA